MRKIVLLFLMLGIFATSKSYSQDSEKGKIFDNWTINASGGLSLFWGDMKQYKFYPVNRYENERNFAFSLTLSKKLSNTFELRGQFIKGEMSGTKRYIKRYFKGEFNEYYIGGTLSFLNLVYGYEPCRRIDIYGVGGIGFIDFRSVKRVLGSNTFVSSTGYSNNGTVEEKMQTETVIPIGFGIKYKIDQRFEVNLENLWTIANSDQLDLTEGKFKYDILTYTSLGITYRFNLRNNPAALAECGDFTSSRAKRGTLGESKVYDDDATKAEKEALNNKLKELENKLNNQESKVKELENKLNNQENKVKELENQSKAKPTDVNIEALKRDIYKSILDTLQRTASTGKTIIGTNYLQLSIFFDVNKFNIKEEEMIKVSSVAELMKKDKNINIKIVGNTDQSGSVEYNNYLSKKRAETVYNALINKYGIEKARLSFEGRGKSEPFSQDKYEINRRVDFIKH